MSDNRRHPSAGTWTFVNAALLVSACIAWGWMDYLYVSQFWTPEQMRAATDWLMLGIIATTMVVNLWVLRTRRTLLHLVGALGATLVVTVLWWMAIVLAGNAFHVAVGGDVG